MEGEASQAALGALAASFAKSSGTSRLIRMQLLLVAGLLEILTQTVMGHSSILQSKMRKMQEIRKISKA
jgi:hypothetical protein